MTTTATSYDTVYSTVPSYDLVPQALVQVMDYNEWTEVTIISELTKCFLEVLILQLSNYTELLFFNLHIIRDMLALRMLLQLLV